MSYKIFILVLAILKFENGWPYPDTIHPIIYGINLNFICNQILIRMVSSTLSELSESFHETASSFTYSRLTFLWTSSIMVKSEKLTFWLLFLIEYAFLIESTSCFHQWELIIMFRSDVCQWHLQNIHSVRRRNLNCEIHSTSIKS